jgi:hypothetical protein
MPQNPPSLEDHIEHRARTDGSYAIAFALLELARAQKDTAQALERLGTNDAATPMGAIEMLASEVKRVADNIDNVSGSLASIGVEMASQAEG